MHGMNIKVKFIVSDVAHQYIHTKVFKEYGYPVINMQSMLHIVSQ